MNNVLKSVKNLKNMKQILIHQIMEVVDVELPICYYKIIKKLMKF
jgi:hypothetical protein